MAQAALRIEERIGLVLAIAAHVGLVVLLAFRPAEKVPPVPQRMQVTLADDVGLTSTSPDPNAQAAPDLAPTLGQAPVSPPVPQVQPAPPPSHPAPASAHLRCL